MPSTLAPPPPQSMIKFSRINFANGSSRCRLLVTNWIDAMFVHKSLAQKGTPQCPSRN